MADKIDVLGRLAAMAAYHGDEWEKIHDGVTELIEADQRAIERMERVLEAAADLNKLLPEAQPIRDRLSTVVGQTSLAIEAKRAALARVKGD